jgi:hypothetical protein
LAPSAEFRPPHADYLPPPPIPDYKPGPPIPPPIADYLEGSHPPPLPTSYLPPKSGYAPPADYHPHHHDDKPAYKPDYDHIHPPDKAYLPPPPPPGKSAYGAPGHASYSPPDKEYLPPPVPDYRPAGYKAGSNVPTRYTPPSKDYLPPLPVPEYIPPIDEDDDLDFPVLGRKHFLNINNRRIGLLKCQIFLKISMICETFLF